MYYVRQTITEAPLPSSHGTHTTHRLAREWGSPGYHNVVTSGHRTLTKKDNNIGLMTLQGMSVSYHLPMSHLLGVPLAVALAD